MARNLELKVRCSDGQLAELQEIAVATGGGPLQRLRQVDTYFLVAQGRLKLREIEDDGGVTTVELIAYRRPDEAGSRWSDYLRVPLDNATGRMIRTALSTACGITAVIDKRRSVATLGRTRIHLDRVSGLGCFVELETVAGPDSDEDALMLEHETMIRMFGLEDLQPVAGSYGDLIETDARRTIPRKEIDS